MMRWIVGSSLRFRFVVVAAAAALAYFGVEQLRDSPVDVFPEFAPPQVEIQTPSLGLSAEEVEGLVTVPLEQALAGTPGLEEIRSKSVPQLSSIRLIFEPGTDLLRARQLVQERVASVTPTLPSWSAPPFMIQPLSATSRVMKIGLSSDELSLIDLSVTAYWKIRARLLRVPGVANVPIWGERLRQFHVNVDPERMTASRVSLNQVMEATANALDVGALLAWSDGAVIGTGGFIDTPNQRLAVRHVAPIVTPRDLARVTLAERDGKKLLLSDVAKLEINHQPLAGDAVINDGPGLMLIVEKLPWANTLDVTRGVEEAIDEMRPGLRGIEIDTTIFRPATFIEESISNLTEALIIGSILVVLVIGAFLFEWRAAAISVVAMPLSLVAAGLVLYERGATINVMVLAGLVIALGVIVDDAIIDVQNIVRRLRQHRREGSDKATSTIVLEASLEMRGPIVYATLIVVLAIVPVFFLTGLTGAFFQPLAFSYALAVLVSLLVALTVTPALSLILLSGAPLERRESPLARRLERGYESVLARIIGRPLGAYAAVAAIVAAGAAVVPFLGQSLLPSFKERDFLMHWLTEPSTSGPEETRISIRACRELRTIPGVRNCGSHIGQALLMDEVVGIYFGENWVSVDPSADYDKTVSRIQELVEGYPGIHRDVQTYLKERIREVLTGASGEIVVRIYGHDLGVLRSKADEVVQAMSGIDGIVDESAELHVDVPQMTIRTNLAAARRYGLKPGDVRRASGVLVASEEVGDIFSGGRAYDVHVWSTPRTRSSLTSVRDLPIDVPTGGQVALGDVAQVRVEPTPNVVEHDNLFRKIDVAGNVSGRDLGSVARDVERAVREVGFPLGYRAELLGEYQERQAAQRRLLSVGVIVAISIFLLLQATFKSWRLAMLSFLTLPMALVGGALAAFIGGGVISLGSLVGFFTVLGIAARNGILLINHFQHLEQYEGETFGPRLVLRGARERLSPIVMTTLATGLAVVPLVAGGNIPGHEIEHPLAVVVLGGLVTSTLLNLFVVPALYLRFGRPSGADSTPRTP
ncbi:MAG TPA: efflux RND transporter permease subunit [Gaiellaceae bacterium]|jgi:CzcA family heavy metal efflux pump